MTAFGDSSGQEYYRMTCSFTGQPLPTEIGRYQYNLTIDPRKSPIERHSGDLYVRKNISPCGADRKTQIDENGDALLTCTGITHTAMTWSLTYTNGTVLNLGTCSWPCDWNIPSASHYSVSRPQYNTSVLNVTGNYRDSIAGTVMCAGLNNSKPVEPAACNVRVVYTSYTVDSLISANTTDWTLQGSSTVDKIYASDDVYSCQWTYAMLNGTVTSIRGQRTMSAFNDSSGQRYHRMTCSFTGQPLPSETGRYQYKLNIDPRKSPNETHSGDLNIKSPQGAPVHNCPSTIVEGGDVSCTCQASPSEPSALVTWDSDVRPVSSTSTLQLTSVQKSQDGHNYTCRQYWGGFDASHVMEVTYMFAVKSRAQHSDHKPVAAVVGGVVGGVALVIAIALVIIVIIRCKRRCDPLYASPVTQGRDPEHTYTELGINQHSRTNAQRTTPHDNSRRDPQCQATRATAASSLNSVSEGHYQNTL